MHRILTRHAAVLLIVAGSLMQAEAFAAEPAEVKTALKAKVAALMPLVAAGKYDTLLQQVGMTADPNRTEYDALREQVSRLSDIGGKYVDFEVVGYKALGTRYQTVYAMAYFQKLPVLFEFGFYYVNGDWQPLRLKVDLNFQSLLDTLPLERP